MSTAGILTLLSVGIGVLFVLNFWATWRVVTDPLSSMSERIAQIGLIWLVPVIGALVALHLRRDPRRAEPLGYRETPDAGDDFGNSGREHRAIRDALDADP